MFSVNQNTNRRALSDYKITVYPTEKFQWEQYRLNVHHKNIKEHRITDKGDVVIKPMRDQFPEAKDFDKYLQEKQKYDSAHPNN